MTISKDQFKQNILNAIKDRALPIKDVLMVVGVYDADIRDGVEELFRDGQIIIRDAQVMKPQHEEEEQ